MFYIRKWKVDQYIDRCEQLQTTTFISVDIFLLGYGYVQLLNILYSKIWTVSVMVLYHWAIITLYT